MNDGSLFKKLTKIKVFPYLILALTAGVILLLFPATPKDIGEADNKKSSLEYTASLEREITELIDGIDGVSSCMVMVYVDSSYSYLYASDQEVEQDETRRKVTKKIVFSSIDGDEVPIVIEEYLPNISGVAVVVDCNDGSVTALIKNMLCSLFDLDESRIFITSQA